MQKAKKPVDKNAYRPYCVLGRCYSPLHPSRIRGFRQQGLASWYGHDFHGKLTSSGEVYDMYAISAAHKTLPLGTWVRVRNLRNNRSLVLKINDRGPFISGRIIDLSVSAAKELGIYYAGTGPVEVIALGMEPEPFTVSDKVEKRNFVPVDYNAGFYTFQVGAFTSLENARELRKRLEQIYKNVKIKSTSAKAGIVYRVLVGRCSSMEKAQHYSNILKKHGFKDVLVIAE